jgi:hypothetical protein
MKGGYGYEARFVDSQTVNVGDARIEARSLSKDSTTGCWMLEFQVSEDEHRPAAPGACAASTSFDNDKL